METRTRVTEHPAPCVSPSLASQPRPDGHLVTTLLRGAFVYATCALCAWDGPGRRASSSADRDAARHRRG